MNCQNCHEPLEPGAAFCGNCGYPVGAAPSASAPLQNNPLPAINDQTAQPPAEPNYQQPPQQTMPTTAQKPPSYAIATPGQHVGETSALLAVILGVIGIAGAGLLIPIIGLVFGVAGLCLGTVSRRKARRRLAIIGIVLAALAIVAGFASLAWNVQHDKNSNQNAQTGQSDKLSKVLSKLSTPCYSFNLIDQYNISNSSGTCNATVFNGQSFATSTNVYKIVATKAGTNNPAAFTQLAKQAIDQDVQNNLPGFSITSQGPASFAGSLAYTVYAADQSQDTAVVETGVLHQTKNGDNTFDILHAINGSNVNLQALEGQWQWN